jgi:peroxiredoxin (alkyl hydroperoxide reductase subunit C)
MPRERAAPLPLAALALAILLGCTACRTACPAAMLARPAPDFAEPAVMGDGSPADVSLGDLRGSYAYIVFYPGDFTFVCPTELIELDKRLDDFDALACRIIGVSVDSVETHAAWRLTPVEDGGVGALRYPLLGDADRSMAAAYGVLAEDGTALRCWFLLDPQGKVRHLLANDGAVGRSVHEALRVLEAVQLTDRYGEVCPADWEPGDETLEPTREGVSEFLSAGGKGERP